MLNHLVSLRQLSFVYEVRFLLVVDGHFHVFSFVIAYFVAELLVLIQMMEELSRSQGKEGRNLLNPQNTSVLFELCLGIRKLVQ